ncbi:MAG TPA: type I restriction-modification enzyme R subunit C-terminal domain-containing protein, partial [Acidimicrobiales bacterium]|nr:type I restriction-modification enzyme R subunit C-terminal domain-containing protein [Acidimicrobiales bacterium]
IRELSSMIQRPPYNWTPARLWGAFEAVAREKVHGSPGRPMTNLVSLVRFALEQDDELFPYRVTVNERFQAWVAGREADGVVFTAEQMAWLERIRDHVANSLSITRDDFEFEPFSGRGGFGRANEAFEGRLAQVLEELNGALAA